MTIAPIDLALLDAPSRRKRGVRTYVRRHPTIVIGGALLCLMTLIAIFAPYLGTVDPQALSPIRRLRWPSAEHWFGTDMLGRDIYSRTIYGARVSLIVGISVALLSCGIGLVDRAYHRLQPLDRRDRHADHGRADVDPGDPDRDRLDGLDPRQPRKRDLRHHRCRRAAGHPPRPRRRADPARAALCRGGAYASGTGFFRILWRHILPNTLPPLLVQGTFVAASAMIVEAILSFLGAGTPPNIPSWGNIMAEGRSLFQVAYYIVLFPGLFLSITVLAINLLGDGLRDALDPRLARRM